MFDVIDCIFNKHDLRLVGLAVAICCLSSVVAFALDRRSINAENRTRCAFCTGAIAGAGVWATHFISMLAYSAPAPISFHVGGTIASLAVAIVGLWAGFGLASAWKNIAAPMVGGALAGLGIAGMHYLGIAAIARTFHLGWDAGLLSASLVIAAGFGAVSFMAARRFPGLAGQILAPVLLAASIAGLHFTGMAALSLTPDLTVTASHALLARSSLAILVAAVVAGILVTAFGLMAVERHNRRLSLRGFETVFQGISSGLALYDRNDRLVLWNNPYRDLILAFGVELCAGMPRADVLTGIASEGGEPRSQEKDLSATVTHLRAMRSDEWRMPDGRWIHVESKTFPNGDSLIFLSDVTALKTTAVLMEEARDRAEAANRAKSEFLANMSHEIRTPLNGVLGMVQVMEMDTMTKPQRERLAIVKQSGGSLLAILNDLLDLAKIEAGKLEIAPVEFDLIELSKGVCALFEGAAAAKDLQLILDLDPECAGAWRGDSLRIRQCLSNLVGNAVKFTESGSVWIKVARNPDGVSLSVQDTGIGIDADLLPRLFEKFSQADGGDTRKYGGTGLGLSISRELVELMGGRLEVESERGRGSCFRIVLPLPHISAAQMAEQGAEATFAGEPMALRILAAEDNKTNQLVLRSLLEPLDVEVTMVDDGAEAVAAFRESRFDIVLMDVQMPILNGVDATLAIRAIEAERGLDRTPIVALTANVMPHQVEAYKKAGMDLALAKPIEIGKLYAALEAALRSNEAQLSAAA